MVGGNTVKIVAFTQLHNELEKGNLHNWFRSLEFCDEIYIFDQASDDGSREVYESHPNTHVIYSPTNRFSEELVCKAELLEKLLAEQPDTDWIFWMDGDTITDKRFTRENVVSILEEQSDKDALIIGHVNLWRSDLHLRLDTRYHSLNFKLWAFWRNNGELQFPRTPGLHQKQYPMGIHSTIKVPLQVIHRGFSTDYQIRKRYNTYRDRGQTGFNLNRLIDESALTVEPVHDDYIPDWYKEWMTRTEDPTTIKPLGNITEVVVASMVYKCPKYYEFIVDQLSRYAKAEDYPVKTMLVANDPTPEIEEMIRKETRIDHVDIYRDPKPNDYYLNRVYRCWNYIGKTAPGNGIVFTNSDMAFTPGWLDNLLAAYEPDNIPCSKLIESGKLRSGTYAIELDFGKSPEEYREEDFLKYADTIKEEGRVSPGGLYMPCLFHKQDFIDAGMYPEGNIHAGGPGAINTKHICSGDVEFFNRTGKKHVTVFDSLVYHIQEGEKDA
jgi:hypothetical protein